MESYEPLYSMFKVEYTSTTYVHFVQVQVRAGIDGHQALHGRRKEGKSVKSDKEGKKIENSNLKDRGTKKM